jgi:hypothetical protein
MTIGEYLSILITGLCFGQMFGEMGRRSAFAETKNTMALVEDLDLTRKNLRRIYKEYTGKKYTLETSFGEFQTDVCACALDLACRNLIAEYLGDTYRATELYRLYIRLAYLCRVTKALKSGKEIYASAKAVLAGAGAKQ